MGPLKLITETIDLKNVGEVEFSWDFDDGEYQDWLQDMSLKPSQDNLFEYVRDNVRFEFEAFDNVFFHHIGYEYCDYDELEETFGNLTAQRIVDELEKNETCRFELSELYNNQDIDINNPEELNKLAMQLLPHGEYYKDCRGFILTNGVVVYTPMEHNNVSIIKGIKGTYDFLRYGNIRTLQQSIDLSQPPTREQRAVLRNVIASYANEELYVDIFTNGQTVSAHYVHPEWRHVLGEIDRFFSEGIKPQGGNLGESVRRKEIIINESQYRRLFKEMS